MKYDMYYEMLDQPKSLKDTFQAEKSHMKEISEKVKDMDNLYLVGCGSSLSTCYSAKDALSMVYDANINVFTGYEFYYHKKIDNENSGLILTSQSGETADTLAALRRANDLGLQTITITNEEESSMMKESAHAVLTRCGRENAILGTKTYVTQLMCLYQILFNAYDTPDSSEILKQLKTLPGIMESQIKSTEVENMELASKFKDEELFYCMGSGPNYGLAYKLALTMFMEGALKHACPLYSGEFRHGLIERVEKNVPVVFLDAGYPGDALTQRALEFCENIGAQNIVFKMSDYADINNLLAPFSLVIPLEWFIYYLAHYNNEDPGSTRHIGKVRY
ncbi:SIS domain-containing protein [Methanobacterium alcaliphilum]|uniref:SIS domain-containing protein n=1 Tax=Methanobacterium alcaliphilum TaxID=392018 RepID=UPI00200AAB80|nr:SIS domain-containing protein [Methanobacterium alcaliphilum]MCK9150924.1 SIS domain-containing protein [Methanobacterium alcaliphilum]